MSECRNCGSQETKDLGFIGEIAPFFLKRVLNLEYGLAPSGQAVKRVLRKIGLFSKAFQKVYAKSVLAELQICDRCSFIQTKRPFPEDEIGCAQEVQTRRVGLTQWLKGKISPEANFSMLDYGGADGMFLPDLPGEKYVFDISDIAPVEGVFRVQNESELGSYSYIQLAHVLEHVPFPRTLTRQAASFLRDSGHLYIEVPQELSDDTRARLANYDSTIGLPIHEHINQYCQRSVTELFHSVGLSTVAIQSELVDFGWNKGTIIRALGRKS